VKKKKKQKTVKDQPAKGAAKLKDQKKSDELSDADLDKVAGGDLYMQNPRGSNDRLNSR
jgi:hypothetical protein